MAPKIWIINKAINNDKNLQPIKTILEARPSAVSQKVTSEGHISCCQRVLRLLGSGQHQIRALVRTPKQPLSDSMYFQLPVN